MGREVLTRPAPQADQRIRYGDDPSHFADLRLPTDPGPHPVVIYVHGGCWRAEWDLTHAGHACAGLTAAGLATWNVEYRRIGNGGGWPATARDVARAADHLLVVGAALGLDLGRIVIAGHSAGGHLAAWLAARHRLPREDPARVEGAISRGVVSIAGLVDLARASALGLCGGAVELLIGGPPAAMPGRYALASPYELLPLGVPQILMAADRDTIVPLEIAERYADRARERGDDVRLIRVPDADHFDLGDPASPHFAPVRDAVLSLV